MAKKGSGLFFGGHNAKNSPDPFFGGRLDLDDLRSLVTLSRTHKNDCGERHVITRLDAGSNVKMLYGHTFTLEVLPGAHRLRIHNTLFWKNIHFTIEPGEHLDFLVSNEARWWTWGMVAVLGSAPLFLRVEKKSRV